MGSVERRLQRLEARAPAALGEEEVRAAACERLSTADLNVLAETLWRLDEFDDGDDLWNPDAWDKLTEDERVAFEAAWGHYEEAMREARAGR